MVLTGNEPVSAANLKAVLAATATKVITMTCDAYPKSYANTTVGVPLVEDVSDGGFVVTDGILSVLKTGVYEISGEFTGSGNYKSSRYNPSDYELRVMVDDRVIYSAPYESSWGTQNINYKLNAVLNSSVEVLSPENRITVGIYAEYSAPSISLGVKGRMTVISK